MASADSGQDARWQRLLSLLAPIHDRVRLTARRLCRSNADGDDLFQEAALRAFARLSDLRDETRFRYWFYAVLLSVHRQRSRRPFWQRLVPLFSDGEHPREKLALSPEEDLGQATRLKKVLSQLAAKEREAIVLFEVDGYSLEEVAHLQASSITAVKSRLSRGRERLRRAYADLEGPDFAQKQEFAHGRKQTAAR